MLRQAGGSAKPQGLFDKRKGAVGIEYPTYKDLCIDVLLRMGEEQCVTGGVITPSASASAFLKAMPVLTRQGLALLATAGRYLVRELTIDQPGDGAGLARYNLRERAPDFYSLMARRVLFNGAPCADYTLEGGGEVLCVPATRRGVWRLYYNAYPASLPAEIPDDTRLELMPEVYALLPLFIEGRLRILHDEDYGTAILNEFEQRRAELEARSRAFWDVVATVLREGSVSL